MYDAVSMRVLERVGDLESNAKRILERRKTFVQPLAQ